MSGRQLLRDALKAGLPSGFQIVSDPRQLDTVARPGACVLWTNRITRPAKLGLDVLSTDLTLWVVTATTKVEAIEDSLDDLLEQVAAVLEPLDAFVWTEADRGVLADKFDGYRLTVTCNHLIEPEPGN